MTQVVKVPTQATLQRTIAPILAQLTLIQQAIAQLQNEVDDFSDGVDLSNYVTLAAFQQIVNNLVATIDSKSDDGHLHAIAHIDGLTEALTHLQTAIAGIVPSPDRHPFKQPSSYLFTHFAGSTLGEFSAGTSGGNGASATFLTNTTEGWYRIGSGTVANARGFVNSGLQALRLGQTVPGQVDAFRARTYLNAVQAASNCSIVQLGFLNSNAGTPSNGVFFQYDASVSPNWQCVTIDNTAITTVDSGIAIDANVNHDFQIVVSAQGADAKFYYDQALVGTISTNIPKTSGREVGVVATIVRKLGTTAHSLSIDHLGGGVRQWL